MFAGKSLYAKTFKSWIGSGDSSTRDQPEPWTTLYIVERELACFACLWYHPLHWLRYHPLHWLRLLTLALSIGIVSIHVFSFHVGFPRSICRWRASKNIVRNNGSLEYIRSLFTRAHPLEPELPSAIKYFFNLIHIRLNVFLKQWVCVEHWIWIPIQWKVPIRE